MELKEQIKKKQGTKSLAQLSRELGVSRQTLYNAINGVGNPSYKLLKALNLVRA